MKKYTQLAYSQLSDKVGRISRLLWRNRFERSQLRNTDFTIISQNCIGGIMYHDLGVKFFSPTVNLLFEPHDFLEFLKNFDICIHQDISFIRTEKKYPVGKLYSQQGGEIMIHFLHYSSEQEANEAWKKRCKRVNRDNIFVLCCDEGLTYEEIVEFDSLEYKNKILFLSKKMPEVKCGIYTKEFQDKTDARLLNFANPFGMRFYQKYINYVKWLNGDAYYIL